MAEELFVRMVDINQLLPNCCDLCREQIEDLQAIRLDGDRLESVKGLLQRVHEDANALLQWANQPITEFRRRAPLSALQLRHLFDTTQRIVERSFKLPVGAMFKDTRQAGILWPRQIAMFVMREVAFASFPEIGRYYEMHHTTVVHSVVKVTERMKVEPGVEKQIKDIIGVVIKDGLLS